MIKLRTHFSRLLANDDGTTAIEYSLIGALLSVVIVGSVTIMGAEIQALFQKVLTALSSK